MTTVMPYKVITVLNIAYSQIIIIVYLIVPCYGTSRLVSVSVSYTAETVDLKL